MSTLHLTVLNDGSVYPELRRIANKHHSGEWVYSAAFSYFRGVVCRLARQEERQSSGEVHYTAGDITDATYDVMEYHVRHACENPLAYRWKLIRGDDNREILFMTKAEAYGYVTGSNGLITLDCIEGASWSIKPITT
jgi:hypothetical protein